MNKLKKISIFTLAILAGVLVISCDSKENATGTLSLSITDAPLDEMGITGVYLAITRVEVKSESAGWDVVESFNDPVTINLLDFQDGNSFLLTENTLEAGGYKEIRLVLDIALHDGGDAENLGTYLEYENGETEPLFVPSGETSGFKAKGDFSIPPGGVVGLTIDFDARKAVVEAGNSDKMLLKPVLRLVENTDVAIIDGTYASETEYALVKVFAYEKDTFTEDELIEESESVEFPNAVTAATVKEDGSFVLAFMETGTYDLVFVQYTEDGTQEGVITIVEDVELEPGDILELPVTTP